VIAALLLLSFGGAVLAAPLTLPFAVHTRWHDAAPTWRGVALLVTVLTVAEVAWAATYVLVGEAMPAIWIVPTVAAVLTIGLLTIRTRGLPGIMAE